jgi:hypothetical protein
MSIVAIPNVFAQHASTVLDAHTATGQTQYDWAVQQALDEKERSPLGRQAVGDTYRDLVYTPLTPCRIVDTRHAGGAILGNTTRTFDVDGISFSGQGGYNGRCGIPYAVARAVAINITATLPQTVGFFVAYGLTARPPTSTLNFVAGQTIANSTIVPVVPGVGNDFSLYSSTTAHVVMDVLGYFAPPQP